MSKLYYTRTPRNMNWRQDFKDAFWKIHRSGQKPTPRLINEALGRYWSKNDLNGAQTKLRTELMLEAGYTKTGQFGRWEMNET